MLLLNWISIFHVLFSFLAVKDSDLWEKSHLQSKGQYGGCMQTTTFTPKFFRNMRHLCDIVSPALSIPSFYRISLAKLLGDEAAGMAFPLDAKYFDDFPVIWGDMHGDVAGIPS